MTGREGIRFGVGLPNSGPLAAPDAILEMAEEAEILGFDSVWVHDHISWPQSKLTHFPTGAVEACEDQDPDFYESVTTAAALAGRLSRVEIGIGGLVLPFRDPRVLGKQLATIDRLSHGRLTVGFAIGGTRSEFDVMQVPWTRRGRIMDEYLDALAAIFAPEQPISFTGEAVSLTDGTFYPRPTGLNVWIAGHGDVALARAVRAGDGWFTAYPEVVSYRERVNRLHELADEGNRDPDTLEKAVIVFVAVAGTHAEAMKLSAATLQQRFGSLERARAVCALGTPSEVAEQLARYPEAGATYLELRCIAPSMSQVTDMMRQIGEEVIPRLNRALKGPNAQSSAQTGLPRVTGHHPLGNPFEMKQSPRGDKA